MTKGEIVLYVRSKAGADAALVLGHIQTESAFRPNAFRNDKNGGSYGLGQLNLATAQDRGFTGCADGLYDPPTNLDLTIAQVEWIKNTLANHEIFDLEPRIAAYNMGCGAIERGGTDPIYVERVLTAMKEFA